MKTTVTGTPQSDLVRERAFSAIYALHATGLGAQVHFLKTTNEDDLPCFDWVVDKSKPFELRFDDRGFKPNDLMVLEEYPYTERFAIVRCYRIIQYPAALKDGWVAISFDFVAFCDSWGVSSGLGLGNRNSWRAIAQ